MGLYPLAVRLESLARPIREAVTQAAQIGFAGVQFDAVGELSPMELSQTGRRQLRHIITSQPLAIVGIGCPTRRGYDSLERLDARVAQTKKALLLAAEMHVPIVINHIGKIPADAADPKTRHFFDSMLAIGREAERVGVQFAIETGLDTPSALAKLLDDLKSPGLAVNFDAANLVARGESSVDDAIRTLAGRIAGVHVKDVAPSGSSIAGYEEAPLGQGIIDWEVVIGALEETNYRGYLTLETDRPVESMEFHSAAIEYLQSL